MPPKARVPNTFRFNSLTLYATFPKCPTQKEVLVQNAQTKWGETPGITWYIACNENHEDGDVHSHILIKFASKINVRTADFADFLSYYDGNKYHGNYQSARNVNDIIKYIKKDGNYIAHPDTPEASNKAKLSSTVAAMLLEGKTMYEINKFDPGYTLVNLKKILEYKVFLTEELAAQGESIKRLPIPMEYEHFTHPCSRIIMTWLNDNLYRRDRPIRSKQLWIKGQPGCGKTTFSDLLSKINRVYFACYENDNFDGYSDDKFDMIIFDEYKSQKKITFLNSVIDGQTKRLNQKYGGTIKKINLPVIFFSNFLPFEAYSKAPAITLDAFTDRLSIVEISTDMFELTAAFSTFLTVEQVAVQEPQSNDNFPAQIELDINQ